MAPDDDEDAPELVAPLCTQPPATHSPLLKAMGSMVEQATDQTAREASGTSAASVARASNLFLRRAREQEHEIGGSVVMAEGAPF